MMRKIKPFIAALFLMVGLFLVAGASCAQRSVSGEVYVAQESPSSSQELAKTILTEAGIAGRYDLYMANAIDLAMTPETAENTAFMAWLNDLAAQEAGWNYVEDFYIERLNSHFSEAELTELLELARQPVMQKWIQFEIDAYLGSVEVRRERLYLLWENYNNNAFTPPPDAMP